MTLTIYAVANKAAQPKTKTKTQPKADTANTITNGVNNLTVADASKAKSKNLDVLTEYNKIKHKNAANFVVIGKRPKSLL